MSQLLRLSSRVTFIVLFVAFFLTGGVGAQSRAESNGEADEPKDLSFAGMEWRNIGPFRGGRSNAAVGVPQEAGVFYFGGVGSGVWKTTDNGENWINLAHDAFKTSSVGAIAVAPSDPNVVYAGMGEHAIRGVMTSHGDGVYRSTDAGATWAHLGLDDTRHISAVVVHPADADTVYVAAQGAAYGRSAERGIFRSRDGGASWEKVLFVSESAGASNLSMDPDNPRVLYAAFWDHIRLPWQVRSGGAGSGIWKSVDGGDSWERLGELVKDGLPALKGKISVSAAPNSDRVYALVEADPGGGLYRSEDGGKTWKNVNENWSLRARAWYYIKVYADPQDPEVVWITNARMYKSIDGGKTFEMVGTPHGDNHHLWIHPENSKILINANDGGANVSINGGESWSTQQNQATAQFYRVNVDHQYPYHVYGGQQDNSAIGIKSAAAGGIGWSDFYSVAGCESSTPVFDRDNPDYIYGGCYMGIVEEWRRETGGSRDVMVVPWMPAALPSRDMKYRFNWNAPMAVSPFDSTEIYHAANVLLRSKDRGVTWTEISPDLTRDEDEKQGPGGGPITNEGAGGEIYGAIYALALSPHERGTIWAGSDDGLVHISRDNGNSWNEITPPNIGEAIINAIEASPHEPGKAYVAVTKYKFNDFEPMAFKTENYGRSWQRIASANNGIEAEDWVRVVREDPVREGLLYLGAENGIYVSFDDGGQWQSLALNMPVTPVSDLIVQGPSNDLVASTTGRGFWILDDLSPLQQRREAVWISDDSSEERGEVSIHLLEPEPVYRPSVEGFRPPSSRTGANPPAATFDFIATNVPEDSEVWLEVVTPDGEVVKRFQGERKLDGVEREPADGLESGSNDEVSSDSDPAPANEGGKGEGREKSVFEQALDATVGKFELKDGHVRVPWDGRLTSVRGVPGLYVFGSLRGRKVVPGEYKVRLTVTPAADSEAQESDEPRGFSVEQPLVVRPDPRESQDGNDYEAQDTLLRQIETELEQLHDAVLRLRLTREQVADLKQRIEKRPEADETLLQAASQLVEDLEAVENELIQKRTVDGQTVINFPTRLNQHFIYLRSAVDSADGLVNQAARDRFSDLSGQWQEINARLEVLLGARVDELNSLVRESGFNLVGVY